MLTPRAAVRMRGNRAFAASGGVPGIRRNRHSEDIAEGKRTTNPRLSGTLTPASLTNCPGVPGGDSSDKELACHPRSPALRSLRRGYGFNGALAALQSQSTPNLLQTARKLTEVVRSPLTMGLSDRRQDG